MYINIIFFVIFWACLMLYLIYLNIRLVFVYSFVDFRIFRSQFIMAISLFDFKKFKNLYIFYQYIDRDLFLKSYLWYMFRKRIDESNSVSENNFFVELGWHMLMQLSSLFWVNMYIKAGGKIISQAHYCCNWLICTSNSIGCPLKQLLLY